MIQANYTIPSEAFDINANSMFNPSCLRDLQVFEKQCTNFKADVLLNFSTRFKWAIIILIVLILIKMFFEYTNFEFAKSEKFKRNILFRIDLSIVVTIICIIGLTFL